MNLLIIEKNISTKNFQEFTFGSPAKEKCFIYSYTPFAQGQDYTFVGGC